MHTYTRVFYKKIEKYKKKKKMNTICIYLSIYMIIGQGFVYLLNQIQVNIFFLTTHVIS